MRRLFLVRHGPTHAKAMIGWTDLPADLSDTAALSRLEAFLPPSALVVSSDLSRAVDTATAIQGVRTRLPHHIDLREMHFGDWEEMSFKQVDAIAPKRLRAFYETPGETSPPNGESWDTLRARTSQAVDTLLAAHPDHDLVVTCHFGVVLSQLQRATGFTSYKTFAQKIDNLSVTEVHIDGGTWSPGLINHIP